MMKFKNILSLTSSILFAVNVYAVELTNSDNSTLLINGKEAVTQIVASDNNGIPLDGFKLLSIETDGDASGLLTLDSGATMNVSIARFGVTGGAYFNMSSSHGVCDIDGNSLFAPDDISGEAWGLLDTSHYLIKSTDGTDTFKAYKQETIDGFDCPTASIDSDGNVSITEGSGEAVSGVILRIDPDVTTEFNAWKSELVLPLHARF
ncbi:TPA: hypothetical protein ACVU5F_004605 [Vibrio parahaemolyticus]